MWNRMKTWIAKAKGVRPSVDLVHKTVIAAGLVAVIAIAFVLGRKGALSECQAQPPSALQEAGAMPASMSDYGQRVVAYIHGNIPVSREELGEFLIARFGAERVEMLVNRKIVDLACKAQNIFVTEQEIDAQVKEEIQALGPGISIKDFNEFILRRFNKNMVEWREDYVRPKLLLSKLVRPTIVVTAEDLKNAFEARYHEKVECRMIVFHKEDKQKFEKWEKASKSEADFNTIAKEQFIQSLAAQGGKVPPIHKHFGDIRIEKEVFALRDGEVSKLLEMPAPDGSFVMFRRDKLIPADTTVREEDVRLKLHREITEWKLAQEVQKVAQRLREQARPQILLRPPPRREDLERAAQQAARPADPMVRPASIDSK